MLGYDGMREMVSNGWFPVLRVLDLRKNYVGDQGMRLFGGSYQEVMGLNQEK